MGLAGPKKNNKIAHDPNNTKWTSDTSSFGHKLMASQGWKPGDYLGAKDANHAEHYTAANASHIRVMVKDDNLGLGAKVGSGVGHGECTGLDAFKNLLGRLNSQDEVELEKEQKSRDELKRAIYMEDRWGSIRFVQGGFLIGDKIQDLIDGEAERIRKLGSSSNSSDDSCSSESDIEVPPPVEKPKKSKKRKLEVEEEIPEVFAVKVKKSKKRKSDPSSEEEMESKVEDSAASQERKRRKEEKRAKRERKEQKRALKAASEEESEKQRKKKVKKEKRKKNPENNSKSSSQITTKENTPSIPSTPLVDSGRSTPMMQGRHAVRSRNIAQKRLASMDVASLNQIFMIKAPS